MEIQDVTTKKQAKQMEVTGWAETEKGRKKMSF